MSADTQMKTQIPRTAIHSPVRAVQLPLPMPERQAGTADIEAQLGAASLLGHSLGNINVSGSAPTQVQRQTDGTEEARDGLRVGPEGGLVPPAVETAIQQAHGGGQPLDGAIQAQMGEKLGHDFSGVRVHTNTQANTLNRQISARAFTIGWDIFFKRGAYNPASESGRKVISHELAHIVQQNSGRVRGDGGMTIRPMGDAFEQEADRVEGGATSLSNNSPQNPPAPSHVNAGHVVQRDGDLEEELKKRKTALEPMLGASSDPGFKEKYEYLASAIRLLEKGNTVAAKSHARMAFGQLPTDLDPGKEFAFWSGEGAEQAAQSKGFATLGETAYGKTVKKLEPKGLFSGNDDEKWAKEKILWTAASEEFASRLPPGQYPAFATPQKVGDVVSKPLSERTPVLKNELGVFEDLNELERKKLRKGHHSMSLNLVK